MRTASRAPLFSAIVIATLALAIGANTAIFTVVDGVLLRSSPYAEPDRLVLLYEKVSAAPRPFGFSAPDFVGFRDRARSYDALGSFRSVEYELSGVKQPVRISAAKVSAVLFDVLGVRPALGRTFTTDEDTGRQPVAMLSNGLWRRTLGADPAVVGRAVLLDQRAYTIVGVMPPDFVGLGRDATASESSLRNGTARCARLRRRHGRPLHRRAGGLRRACPPREPRRVDPMRALRIE